MVRSRPLHPSFQTCQHPKTPTQAAKEYPHFHRPNPRRTHKPPPHLRPPPSQRSSPPPGLQFRGGSLASSALWVVLVSVVLPGGSGPVVVSAGETWGMVSICPFHCVCRNLSESLSTLCVNKGLLFVPSDIDRRTVELRLADNFILEVGGPDFENMTGLVDLTLSRNTIHALRPLAFADLESLRSLHLDANRITAVGGQDLTGLLNLQHLFINNNQLTHVAPDAFDDFLPSLEDLDLSYNNLRRVPWDAIQSMASLTSLNLDHNLIDQIAEGSFSELYNLARLDMTSNRLQTLPPDPLFSRSQIGAVNPTPYYPVISLNFGGNPLHCNCELLWLRRLVRLDDMETCATPPHLAGRYFWSIPEEEFVCEPPLITRSSNRVWVLEGQRATLKCRAIGDPEPLVHWVSPDDRIVANTSRVRSYYNGTLDVLVTRARDDGSYTCIAINAAGEATALVDLKIIPLPHRGNGTVPLVNSREPGPSDISAGRGGGGGVGVEVGVVVVQNSSVEDGGATRDGGGGGGPGGRTGTGSDTGSDAGRSQGGGGSERLVRVQGVTSNSAQVRWVMGRSAAPYMVWMYQIQYNSTADDALVYRILPPNSQSFVLKNLVPGADYSLCVLAIFDDGVSSLATTKVVGCTQFSTREDFPECRSLQAHFLGGTLTVLVGGVIVVTLLVFTVAMMVRHRVCGDCRDDRVHGNEFLSGKGVDVFAQTNGSGGAVMMVALPNGVLAQQPKARVKLNPPRTLPRAKRSIEDRGEGKKEGYEAPAKEKRHPPFTPENERVPLYYSPARHGHEQQHKAVKRPGKLKLQGGGERRRGEDQEPERDRERDVDRDRERDVERDRKRDVERDRERDVERDRERDVERDRERERDVDRERDREQDVDRERDVERDVDRERERTVSSKQALVCSTTGPRDGAADWQSLADQQQIVPAKRSCSFDVGEITTTTTCYSYAKRLGVIWTRRSQSLHGMLVHCASSASSTSSTASEHYGRALTHGFIRAYGSNNSNSSNSNCSVAAAAGDLEESRL